MILDWLILVPDGQEWVLHTQLRATRPEAEAACRNIQEAWPDQAVALVQGKLEFPLSLGVVL